MSGVDGRGSKDQRILYDYLTQLYPLYKIVYEYPLYEVNQRLDLFIPSLGLAIEYHGRQHMEFVQHFHKEIEGFKYGKAQDQKKIEYLSLKGIKLVEIPYNQMVNSKEELQELIDSIPYPDIEYNGLETVSESKENFLNTQRDFRKNLYKKTKEKTKEDVEHRKERLEKERQYRKDLYRKHKESR